MAGFENSVMVAKNVNFDELGAKPHSGIINAAGKLMIGTGNSSPTAEILGGSLTSPDSSITFGYSSPNITATIAGGSTTIQTITGNTGGAISPAAGNFNFLTSNTTVKFAGTAATETLNFGLSNLVLGNNAASITIGTNNVGLGSGLYASLTQGSSNTFVGTNVVGPMPLSTGSQNSGFGQNALGQIGTGQNNTAIGYQAGSQYSGADSGNISIGHIGVGGESSTIRVGTQGVGTNQNRAFIAGITGVTVSNPAPVMLDTTTGQLGQVSVVPLSLGGTNANLTAANGGILYSTASAVAILAATATAGQMLRSGANSAPTWSTATFPSTATSTGTILRSDGTNWVATTATYPATTTANQILYSSATNVIGQITAVNSAVLTTNGSGVPSLTTSLSIAGAIASTGSTVTGNTGVTATTGNVTATAGALVAGTNVTLPATSSTAGNVLINAQRVLHNYGSATNIFVGALAGNYTLTATNTTGVGRSVFASLTSGIQNTSLGDLSSNLMSNGANNASFGFAAANAITSGSQNTSFGGESNTTLQTGSYNTSIGYRAGFSYTGAESSNILINNLGLAGESNVMRLGTSGSSAYQVNKCYLAGVNGVTVTGTAVLCATDGQLGTIASSERYKENIKNIQDDVSILNLTPREFNYKEDENKTKCYGLIAEEMHAKFPYLCFYKDGEPESVKYHEIPTLLLMELQRLSKRIDVLEQQLGEKNV